MSDWTIFVNPMTLRLDNILWLLPPLCLSVAIVYKTIRTPRLARVPMEVFLLLVYMSGGLLALGIVLWAIQEFWL